MLWVMRSNSHHRRHRHRRHRHRRHRHRHHRHHHLMIDILEYVTLYPFRFGFLFEAAGTAADPAESLNPKRVHT